MEKAKTNIGISNEIKLLHKHAASTLLQILEDDGKIRDRGECTFYLVDGVISMIERADMLADRLYENQKNAG